MPVRGFSIDWMSSSDGPGTRIVVFLQGCMQSCPWCHAPHSQPEQAPVLFFSGHCRQCGACAQACDHAAHVLLKGRHQYLRERCGGCGSCVRACVGASPGQGPNALQFTGWSLEPEALWQLLLPQLTLLGCSGGLTLSGGEPLWQVDALIPLLRLAAERQCHVAIETSGLVPEESVRRIRPWVSLWLFGLRAVAGTSGEPNIPSLALATFAAACRDPDRVTVRLPLIPGYTDSTAALAKVAEAALGRGVRRVELLPLHSGWAHYRRAMGMPVDPTMPLSYPRERLLEVIEFLSSAGMHVHAP